MRRISLVLLVLALIVGIAVPCFWASAIPVYLGAALLVLAGLLAKRVWFAVAAIAAAVLLVLAPGVIDDYRNGRGISWAVPEGERLRLAEDGLAVTSTGSALRGRDLSTGERRWELPMPKGDGDVRVWRIGDRLVVNWSDDILRAIGVEDGKEQWQAVPLDTQYVGVTDGEHLALTRCSGLPQCEVQSISLETGLVAWRADVVGSGNYLGVPLPGRGAPNRELPPWRASFVLISDEDDWEARDLTTGRVLKTGSRRDGSMTPLGDVLVESTRDGALTGTDVQTGERLWSRPAGDGKASLSPIVSQDALALPEGVLVLSGDGYAIDSVRLGDRLRTLNTHTGELREAPLDTGYGLVEVLGSAQPASKRPVVFAREYEDDRSTGTIAADGRTYTRAELRDVYVTPNTIGFEREGHTWGTGDDRVIEIFDRNNGDRVVRFNGEEATIYARGDALLIAEGGGDDPAVHVVVR